MDLLRLPTVDITVVHHIVEAEWHCLLRCSGLPGLKRWQSMSHLEFRGTIVLRMSFTFPVNLSTSSTHLGTSTQPPPPISKEMIKTQESREYEVAARLRTVTLLSSCCAEGHCPSRVYRDGISHTDGDDVVDETLELNEGIAGDQSLGLTF